MATANILVTRYSKALFQSAKDSKTIDTVLSELEALNEVMSVSSLVSRLLLNSVVPTRIKKPLLESVVSKIKLGKLTQSLINQLVRNNRLNIFSAIVLSFKRMAVEDKGVLYAELKTAVEMDDKNLKTIKAELESALGKSVQLEAVVEKNLLGGFSVTVDSKKIDCTLKSKLNKLKQRLVAVEF